MSVTGLLIAGPQRCGVPIMCYTHTNTHRSVEQLLLSTQTAAGATKNQSIINDGFTLQLSSMVTCSSLLGVQPLNAAEGESAVRVLLFQVEVHQNSN